MEKSKKVIKVLIALSLSMTITTGLCACTNNVPKTTTLVKAASKCTGSSNIEENLLYSHLEDEKYYKNVRVKEKKAKDDAELVRSLTGLKLGDKGKEVIELQIKLYCLGYNIEVDSSFGKATANILQQVQQKLGVASNGVYNEETKSKMGGLSNVRTYTPPTIVQQKVANNITASAKVCTDGLMQAEIPKLGLFMGVRRGSGDYQAVLSYSIGMMQDGPTPDMQYSNVTIFAHNTNQFKHLNTLVVGDIAKLHYLGVTYTYKVESMFVVDENNVGILDSQGYACLTMFTCIVGQKQNRYVVRAKLISTN